MKPIAREEPQTRFKAVLRKADRPSPPRRVIPPAAVRPHPVLPPVRHRRAHRRPPIKLVNAPPAERRWANPPEPAARRAPEPRRISTPAPARRASALRAPAELQRVTW